VQDVQMSNEFWEAGTSRGGFLRRAAKTLAVGLGVALVPASRAWAVSPHCCPDASCQSDCSPNQFGYSCYDSCVNKTCCVCLSTNPGCHDVPCGACG
jgi:hypothetical protein